MTLATTPARPLPQPLLDQMLSHEVLGNPVRAWVLAGLFTLAIIAGFWALRRVVLARLRAVAHKTETKLDDLAIELLSDVRPWCILVVALYAGLQHVVLPTGIDRSARIVAVVTIALQLLLTSRLAVEFLILNLAHRTRRADGKPDPSIASATGVIRFIATLVLATILLLLVLANLNVEITPLITGLGIGGIAIALAAQSILGDLFASLSILFDKPFQVGDFIVVGDMSGTVEKIGVKSTLVRSISGEQIVFRNTDLLGSRIRNFQRLEERRIVFTINLVYETPPALLRQVPGIVAEVVAAQPTTRFDRCHFKTLAAYSLDFETVYFVAHPDMRTYLDIQQSINLALVERFAALGISFAYPTAVEIQRPDRAAR